MSIQPLPRDVVAQIKSSTVITSLNNAIFGLVQNSLDADATKINISVNYRHGNCSVEDNGTGILPHSFHEGGGLGQLHYTSKYPTRVDCHGGHGEFLASLASLSLLTVSSHHRDYRSHNSVTIHNSRVATRHTPALQDQRVLLFPSGTRVSVRDLFGSMPVRVKQRAAEVERLGTARYFDQLIFMSVALLLAWPGDATITLQEVGAARTVSLHTTTVQSAARDIVTRTPLLLAEASLVEQRDLTSWVSIGATTPGISVTGCVSLQPVATKHVQFIALGVQPLLNEHHSNFLYEEVNKVFAHSSFGVVEEAPVDEDGKLLKTSGFTLKELKPKKGVDRWPMFFLHIKMEDRSQSIDVDELFDENHQQLAKVTDLLQVMAYEFLKKHHFRPRSIHAIDEFRKEKASNSASSSRHSSASASVPPKLESKSKRDSSKQSVRRKAATQRSRGEVSDSRSASVFTSWSRIKPSTEEGSAAKHGLPSDPAPSTYLPNSRSQSLPVDGSPTLNVTLKPLKPLFDHTGSLLRRPFDDVGESSPSGMAKTSQHFGADSTPQTEDGGAIVWIDPVTKSKSFIDPRTGFAVRPKSKHYSGNSESGQERGKEAAFSARVSGAVPIKFGRDLILSRPLKRVKSSPSQRSDTIFQPKEAPVPRLPQETEIWGCPRPEGQNHGCHPLAGSGEHGVAFKGLEGRISKDDLQKLELVNQVDKKFILAKVFTDHRDNISSNSHRGYTLVLIDQHAADERCRLEDLLKGYFIPDPSDFNYLLADSANLDKTLRFDLSKQEGELLARLRKHFAHWGIEYSVLLEQQIPTHNAKATVEVRMLPPCILERSQLEPRMLIELLRKEAWKVHETPSRQVTGRVRVTGNEKGWFARFHNCPEGLMEMINSKACRSSIMFNDVLTERQCADLVKRLAACAFPFQCAHGRPSLVPAVHIGADSPLGTFGEHQGAGRGGRLSGSLKRWKASME